MADRSQKWHDGSSSRNIESSSNSKGIAVIVSNLESLGRNMKKLKENVHAIQVGCQTCGGAHLNKECPLNEEVKSVEEVVYANKEAPLDNTINEPHGTDNQEKDEKQRQNDKTRLGMEKTVKDKAKSKPE
ncbi:hypothetical protein Tco_1333921, partial [Tanacetum coccineum]